jgi:very-short-patch-repair endonuclease
VTTSRKLRAQNVVVLRFWEHDVKSRINYCVRQINAALQ